MREKIVEIMTHVFKLEEIQDNVSRKDCAEWDSLNHLNLVVELESSFNVTIEPEEIVEMRTLQDIEKILGMKLGEK